MIPESLAAALDTMPEQRQAIADGLATKETYEALSRRVAVFEALDNAACEQLAAIGTTDWAALHEHVPACPTCRPKNPKRLRETAEHLAPGLVAVPEDEERKWVAAFFHNPVRAVSDVVTRPVRALVEMVKANPVLADPHVVKAGLSIVGIAVAVLLAGPSSQRVEPTPESEAQSLPGSVSEPTVTTTPPAGPSASIVPSAGTITATASPPTGTTSGQQQQPVPPTQGPATPNRPVVATANAWAYASTSFGQYDQPVGQEVELHRQWQWGTWRRAGVERYVTLIRVGEGAYVVRLPEVGQSGGTVHTELTNGWGYPQPFSCQTQSTRTAGVDLLVDVVCFNPNGTRKNLPFAIVYVNDGPAVHYRGGANGVTKTGPGQYDVTTLGGNGFAMVSPVGPTQARCRSTVEATRVRVACDADTDWNLTYTNGAAIHHDPSAPAAYLTTGTNAWSSNGETPSVTRTGVGQYDVQYQSIGNPRIYPADSVLVSASGPEPRYCRIWAWNGYSFPPKVLVQIRCYDQAGAAADSAFALAYLRSP